MSFQNSTRNMALVSSIRSMSVAKVKVGTWDTLRLHPMTLMRMVIEDKANVIGKDKRGRKIYEVKEESLNDSRQ